MLVLSSPSGAGKTTIARRLARANDNGIAMSISHTTRAKRKGEKDGKDYHFVDHDTFTRMRDQGEFLEWAVVFDNYYGTTRKPGRAWRWREVATCCSMSIGRGPRPCATGRRTTSSLSLSCRRRRPTSSRA